MVSRRWVLTGLLASAAVPGCAEAPSHSPRPEARPGGGSSAASAKTTGATGRIVEAAGLGGAVGFIVAETGSGRILDQMNAELALPPASVAKALTGFYALDRLGAGHRFTTRVFGTGPVSNGRLAGDLVLTGSGDPSLDTDRLGDLAAALAAKGIKEISGKFYVHDGALPRIGQIDADQPVHVGYNPSISGLNLNYNRVNFEWKRGSNGYSLSMDARGKRFLPRVSMAEIKAVNRDAPLFTFKGNNTSDQWTVSAQALGKAGSRWLPVRQPDLYAAEVFSTLMAAHGLRLPAPIRLSSMPGGTVLAETRSEPLTEVMRDMLRYSTNITAEVLGLSSSGAGSLPASGQQMSSWLAQTHGVSSHFVDHSGLGGDSRIAPAEMLRALQAARGTALPGLLREQGLRDEKGREIKNHSTRVFAKTGTLNFVSGLAGYIRPSQGKDLTFAIFSADTKRRDGLPRSEREQPQGGHQWTRRARFMQAELLNHWAAAYT